MAFDGSRADGYGDFEEVLDFPLRAHSGHPYGITSHADRLWVADAAGDELWRSTVANPTLTSHFEKVLDFPSGLTFPAGLTSHADRLWVADDTGDELWRSTVADPTLRALRESPRLPSGLASPRPHVAC